MADPAAREATLPESAEIAGFLALMFKRLGGVFTVGQNGARYAGRPTRGAFRLGAELPQLPGAEAHERFHSPEEWEGAIKLVDYALSRVADRDRDWVYQAFAAFDVGDGEGFDFRTRLSRSG